MKKSNHAEKEYISYLKDLLTFDGEEKFTSEEIKVLYFELSELSSLREEIKNKDIENEQEYLLKLEELLRPYKNIHSYFIKKFSKYIPTLTST
ncbi:hypothetical protein [Persephonella sp.]